MLGFKKICTRKIFFVSTSIAIFVFYGNTTFAQQLYKVSQTGSIILFDDRDSVNLFSDEVTIDSTFIVADSLQLFVSYASCEQDSFSLYGYKVFLESLPAQAELYLSKGIHYESNCKMIITEKLIFDLSLLKDLYLQGSKDSTGTIMVRIHEPDKSEPIFPLVKYKF